MSAFLVLTPPHRIDPCLAIAAARAGEVGILDLGYAENHQAQWAALRAVEHDGGSRGTRWGVRWDAWGRTEGSVSALADLATRRWPLLIIAGVPEEHGALCGELEEARKYADKVYLEVYTLQQALRAEVSGFDGVIVKGNEASARVGQESTFILLQRLHGQLKIPWYVQGGIAPDTAAAAFLVGAAGVVLCEQVWLAAESPLSRTERQIWAGLDGSETTTVGQGEVRYRFFNRGNRDVFDQIERSCAESDDWQALLRTRMVADAKRVRLDDDFRNVLVPVSPDIAFGRRLADENVTVAGILDAFKARVEENMREAAANSALSPNSPMAKAVRTEFPILQGPMTRVSDVTPFCRSVAENGALPFLALALMREQEVRTLLTQTKSQLGDKSWGVGILGFVPAELRKEQLAVVHDVRPPFAIIAGGRPGQARQLEEHGISTFLHVPSPGLLEAFIQDGCRKFVFEGRECGGHVGPRSSFVLWQSAINVLSSAKVSRPEEFQLVFAGGIHNSLSAAMVAALAAPLTARGMKIGVLMGTAYLFTHEAVECGAILPEFQDQAVHCVETVLLKTGIGHETRCSATPFADEFNAARDLLLREGKSPEDVRNALEQLNLGRLRIAAKGLMRQAVEVGSNRKGDIYRADSEEQRKNGMYMIGQVAALRDTTIPMRDLHLDVAQRGSKQLCRMSTRRLPWQQAKKPVARSKGRAKRVEKSADIAIIGLAGVFPKASDHRRFWENIVERRHAFQEVPPERWRAEDFFTPGGLQPDRVYSNWGAFLGEMVFDPMKWLIPPASIPSIDPTQLIALEVAWRALVDAGYGRRKFARNRMGVVFASAGATEMELQYAVRTMMRHYLPQLDGITNETAKRVLEELEELLPHWTEDSFAGFLHNVTAGRIANRLNLGGPNFVVDSACASSLTAVYTAVEHLRFGASDTMIVGATDVTNHPVCFMSFAQTQALSRTGPPRPFDQSADGISLGECVAAIVLKRLSDAERDGDKIYALIKGIGASSDGKAKSMTSPDPPGQIAALTRAYKDAGVPADSVTLIEAHATGTPVGDGAEITSMKKFFASTKGNARQIAVGSIKSMIGHTKSAAGLASLVKTALALDQRVLPPTIGVEKPHVELLDADSPLYVNSAVRPWLAPADGTPRRAGMNSFGFGGTNFHVILEEYAGSYHQQFDIDLTPRPAEIVFWTGESRAEIEVAIEQLLARLATAPVDGLAQLCRSICLDSARSRLASDTCRMSLVATSVEDLTKKLQRSRERLKRSETSIVDDSGIFYSEAGSVAPSEVCFLYPGQGAQSVNMLRDLLICSRWAHELFARLDTNFQKEFAKPLSQFLYPPPAFTKAEQMTQQSELNDTRVAQPALGTVEAFATRLLERFGIVPRRAAGHSYGEYVALWAADCLSLDDLLKLSMQRGRIVADAGRDEPGAMAAVAANAADALEALQKVGSKAVPANFNSPNQTIIAGTVVEIERTVAEFTKIGLWARKIPVTAAFHTPAMQSAAEKLSEQLREVEFRKPVFPVSSNTTGSLYPESTDEIRSLLARHLVEPVQFESQIRQLHADGVRLFLEVGPGSVLTKLVRSIINNDTGCTMLALDAPGTHGFLQLANVLARTAVLGLPVKIDAWFEGRGLQDIALSALLEEVTEQSVPKPHDWILAASRARPASASVKQSKSGARQPSDGSGSGGTGPSVPTRRAIDFRAQSGARVDESKVPARKENGNLGGVAKHNASAALQLLTQKQESNFSTSELPERVDSTSSIHLGKEASMHQSQLIVSEQPECQTRAEAEWLPILQNTMSQWLEVQASQNRLLERFLDFQERLVFGTTPTNTVRPSPRAISAPAFRPAPPASVERPAPAVAQRAPAPFPVQTSGLQRPRVVIPEPPRGKDAPTPTVAVAPRPIATSTAPVVSPIAQPQQAVAWSAMSNTAPITTESQKADGKDYAPSTEDFRRDLLLAVSQRTGYPVDVLDEDTPLEAGLGIDSIKTVEIFSKLKKYHSYFRAIDEDDEEMLLKFSQLKTLRAIAEWYAARHARMAVSPSGGNGAVQTAAGNGSAPSSDEEPSKEADVRRFSVAAVEAPSGSQIQKKNSRTST